MSSDELKEKMGEEVGELKAEASGALDKYFGITASGSSVSTEIRAGLTTWLAMAYIIFVNPAILSNAIDVDQAQLVTVTALAAAFGTLLMGLGQSYRSRWHRGWA